MGLEVKVHCAEIRCTDHVPHLWSVGVISFSSDFVFQSHEFVNQLYKVTLSWLQQFGQQYGPNHDVPENSICGHHWGPFRPISMIPKIEGLCEQYLRILHANGWERYHCYDELKWKKNRQIKAGPTLCKYTTNREDFRNNLHSSLENENAKCNHDQ